MDRPPTAHLASGWKESAHVSVNHDLWEAPPVSVTGAGPQGTLSSQGPSLPGAATTPVLWPGHHFTPLTSPPSPHIPPRDSPHLPRGEWPRGPPAGVPISTLGSWAPHTHTRELTHTRAHTHFAAPGRPLCQPHGKGGESASASAPPRFAGQPLPHALPVGEALLPPVTWEEKPPEGV